MRPRGAVDLYTRQSCLRVSACDLAAMGATLADGGVNPLTGERVVAADTCRYVLAVMTTAGLYETSGDWLYDVGLPGESGIGGGIVTVSPGKGAPAPSRRRSTLRGTASEGSSPRGSSPAGSVSTCSRRPAGRSVVACPVRGARCAAATASVEAPRPAAGRRWRAVEDDGGERRLLAPPAAVSPTVKPNSADADAAGDRDERREERDRDVDQEEVGSGSHRCPTQSDTLRAAWRRDGVRNREVRHQRPDLRHCRVLRLRDDGRAEPPPRSDGSGHASPDGRSTSSGISSARCPSAIDGYFGDRLGQHAAGIAYRVLFSLAPLSIVLVSIVGVVLQTTSGGST